MEIQRLCFPIIAGFMSKIFILMAMHLYFVRVFVEILYFNLYTRAR